jgi:1-acyl-sn-glycerol-3-phosphate acyltransferase
MFYKFAQAVMGLYLFVAYRVRVYGKEHIPPKGAAILCSNHLHGLDPVVLGACLKRQIFFLAKKELFRNKLFTAVLLGLGAVRLDREATDMEAYRTALGILKTGNLMGIFAQGGRMKEMDTRGAKSGVAMFALKTGAPVVPVAIHTTYKPFTPIIIRCGEPVNLEEFKSARLKSDILAAATDKIMGRVEALLREAACP